MSVGNQNAIVIRLLYQEMIEKIVIKNRQNSKFNKLNVFSLLFLLIFLEAFSWPGWKTSLLPFSIIPLIHHIKQGRILIFHPPHFTPNQTDHAMKFSEFILLIFLFSYLESISPTHAAVDSQIPVNNAYQSKKFFCN